MLEYQRRLPGGGHPRTLSPTDEGRWDAGSITRIFSVRLGWGHLTDHRGCRSRRRLLLIQVPLLPNSVDSEVDLNGLVAKPDDVDEATCGVGQRRGATSTCFDAGSSEFPMRFR